MNQTLRKCSGGLLCAFLLFCALSAGAQKNGPLPDLTRLDFSACRLIVAGGTASDEAHLLARMGQLALYQYATEEETRAAFALFAADAEFVETDGVIRAADGESESSEEAPMTREDNPFTALEEIIEETDDAAPENTDGSSAPLIALIDTGADESLTFEAVSLIGDDPSDDNGHGTRMAQYILRENPAARILSIKAVGADGCGEISTFCAALEYAVACGADIINLSLSTPRKPDSAAIESAIENALSAGIRVVAAAGNQGQKASFYLPGCIEAAEVGRAHV